MQRTLILLLLASVASSKLKWRQLFAKNDSDQFPAPRRDSSIGYDRAANQLVIFGGKGSENFGDTWIFDLEVKNWTKVPATTDSKGVSIPEKRFSMVYGTAGKFFYISTGEYSGSPRTFFNDILQFEFATKKWKRLGENSKVKPEVRYGSSGGIFDDGSGKNGFYVTHGFSGTRYSNTFKFDFDKDEWQEKFSGSNNYNPKYPHSRCLQGGTMIKPDELVMYGGCLGYVQLLKKQMKKFILSKQLSILI